MGMRGGVGAGGPEGPGRQLALVRLVLAHRRRALHREGRQYERRDERAVAPPQLDHRDIASLAPAASVERDPEAGRLVLLEPAEDLAVVVAPRRVLEWPRPVVPPVEVRADSGRVERRAVVELDPTAQRERPGLAVAARRPARCQFRLQLRRARLQLDETLVDLLGDSERLAVEDEGRIQICRISY